MSNNHYVFDPQALHKQQAAHLSALAKYRFAPSNNNTTSGSEPNDDFATARAKHRQEALARLHNMRSTKEQYAEERKKEIARRLASLEAQRKQQNALEKRNRQLVNEAEKQKQRLNAASVRVTKAAIPFTRGTLPSNVRTAATALARQRRNATPASQAPSPDYRRLMSVRHRYARSDDDSDDFNDDDNYDDNFGNYGNNTSPKQSGVPNAKQPPTLQNRIRAGFRNARGRTRAD